MKKFPFSNKAIKTAFAASLVVPTIATTASVEASSIDPQNVEKTQDVFVKIENNLRDFEKAEINSLKTRIQDDVHSSVWDSILQSNIPDVSKHETIKGLSREFLNAFYSTFNNEADAKTPSEEVADYIANNSSELEAVFGSNYEQTVNLLFDFTQAYYVNLYSKQDEEAELISLLSKSKKELAKEVFTETKTSFADFSTLQEGLGFADLTVEKFFSIHEQLIHVLDPEDKVQAALTSSVVRAKDGSITLDGSSVTPDTNLFVGQAKELGFKIKVSGSYLNLADLLQWEESNSTYVTIQEQEITAKQAGVNQDVMISAKYNGYTVIQEKINIKALPSSGVVVGDKSSGTDTPATNITKIEKWQNATGKNVIKVKFDKTTLVSWLDSQAQFNKLTIKVEKDAANDFVEVDLAGDIVKLLKAKNKNASIEIDAGDSTYTLPIKEIELSKYSTQLNTSEEELITSIQLNINEEQVKTVTKNNLRTVSPIQDFKVMVIGKGASLEDKKFTAFVNRSIKANKAVNSARATVVRLNEDGTFTSIPTLFDGKTALFKSMTNSSYAVVENEKTFADIQNWWNQEDIEKLASKYIVNGVSETNYAPKKATTRAELTALLTRSLGLLDDEATTISFSDVAGNEWFAEELEAAVDAGIITGFEDRTFKPDEIVTREQAAAMIRRAMEFVSYDENQLNGSKVANSFNDYATVSDWAKADLEVIIQAGIMNGKDNGSFDPTDDTTRDQMAAVLERFLKFVNFMN